MLQDSLMQKEYNRSLDYKVDFTILTDIIVDASDKWGREIIISFLKTMIKMLEGKYK